MFGREVTIKLKANAAAELTRIGESDIIPILGGRRASAMDHLHRVRAWEAIASSFWATQEDVEACSRTGYLKY